MGWAFWVGRLSPYWFNLEIKIIISFHFLEFAKKYCEIRKKYIFCNKGVSDRV